MVCAGGGGLNGAGKDGSEVQKGGRQRGEVSKKTRVRPIELLTILYTVAWQLDKGKDPAKLR